MTIAELHSKLQSEGISPDEYYLHGLYGSTDDNNKPALTIRKGKFGPEYETYYKERGEKHSSQVFFDEGKACEYLYKRIIECSILEKISKIEGLSGMTVNERLHASGLMDEFDKSRKKDKTKARQILRWLMVDEASINKMV